MTSVEINARHENKYINTDVRIYKKNDRSLNNRKNHARCTKNKCFRRSFVRACAFLFISECIINTYAYSYAYMH